MHTTTTTPLKLTPKKDPRGYAPNDTYVSMMLMLFGAKLTGGDFPEDFKGPYLTPEELNSQAGVRMAFESLEGYASRSNDPVSYNRMAEQVLCHMEPCDYYELVTLEGTFRCYEDGSMALYFPTGYIHDCSLLGMAGIVFFDGSVTAAEMQADTAGNKPLTSADQAIIHFYRSGGPRAAGN